MVMTGDDSFVALVVVILALHHGSGVHAVGAEGEVQFLSAPTTSNSITFLRKPYEPLP